CATARQRATDLSTLFRYLQCAPTPSPRLPSRHSMRNISPRKCGICRRLLPQPSRLRRRRNRLAVPSKTSPLQTAPYHPLRKHALRSVLSISHHRNGRSNKRWRASMSPGSKILLPLAIIDTLGRNCTYSSLFCPAQGFSCGRSRRSLRYTSVRPSFCIRRSPKFRKLLPRICYSESVSVPLH